MNTVRIVHPEAGEADVPESAVPHWRSSGWELAPEPEKPPAARETEQDSKPRGSRRRSSEGDE